MPTGEKTLTKVALFQKVNKLEKYMYTHSKKGQALLPKKQKNYQLTLWSSSFTCLLRHTKVIFTAHLWALFSSF